MLFNKFRNNRKCTNYQPWKWRNSYRSTRSKWFHPQGGGQKSDRGTIEEISVIRVAHNNGEIDHYVETIAPFSAGQEVEIWVDPEWRLLNAKHHTAGHLIAALIENRFPTLKATSAHHWLNEARVEFAGELPTPEQVKTMLPDALAEAISDNLPVQICGDIPNNRAIAIGNYPAVACGGTHLEALGTLGRVEIVKANVQKGKLRIRYRV